MQHRRDRVVYVLVFLEHPIPCASGLFEATTHQFGHRFGGGMQLLPWGVFMTECTRQCVQVAPASGRLR